MKYLLDTHVCLWAISDNSKLSPVVKNVLDDPINEMMVSQVSLWEIAIKYRLGKFPEFTVGLDEFIAAIVKAGFIILPVKNGHLIAYFNFAHFTEDHKDPFDRLLLATADVEKASFITKDEKFTAYKNRLRIVW